MAPTTSAHSPLSSARRVAALIVFAFFLATPSGALGQALPGNASESLARGEALVAEALATYDAQYPDRPLWRQAFAAGRTALDLAPGHPEVLHFLARAYSLSNWHGPAIETWQEYAAAGGRLSEEDAELFAISGNWNAFAAYSRGDLQGAASQYALVINYVPENVEAHRWLGRIMLETRRPEQAIPAWRTVLELDPDAEGAAYFLELAQAQARWGIDAANDFYLGINRYEAGNLTQARTSFAAATARNAEYAAAWAWSGRVAFEQGFYEDAFIAYGRALALEPNNANYQWFTRESQRLAFPEPEPVEEEQGVSDGAEVSTGQN